MIVNCVRASVMDPESEVQRFACEVVTVLCERGGESLLHFSQILARAILLPLVNPKSKNRIAALRSLTSILHVGIWKHNAFIMEILIGSNLNYYFKIGFRDPNTVNIQDFFHYSTKFNYFAILINDKNASVRT